MFICFIILVSYHFKSRIKKSLKFLEIEILTIKPKTCYTLSDEYLCFILQINPLWRERWRKLEERTNEENLKLKVIEARGHVKFLFLLLIYLTFSLVNT